MLGGVALLLHAHLPFVRHPEHRRSLEERWLYEALWESYLPICDMLGRLAADRVRAPFTLSVSPPLAAMLADDLLRRRFDDHLARLERLASGARRFVPASLGAVLDFYRARLAMARATWDRVGGDVLGAWVGHARAGRLELWTTAATHAYLPGLAAAPASLRAQIVLGNKAFEAIAREAPRGFWLPECGFVPSLDAALADGWRAGHRARRARTRARHASPAERTALPDLVVERRRLRRARCRRLGGRLVTADGVSGTLRVP